MSATICRQCFVSGHVQGVFFRASAAQRARALGVTGYAINLDDGRVEVLACGRAAAVDALCEWLHVGPSGARVTEVVDQPVAREAPREFRTG